MMKSVTEWARQPGARPVVSIVCWSYNHERFISQAVQSFLSQETSFPIEIIIHDDASTDGSAEICRSFEAQYPNVFRNILQKTNLFQAGRDINEPPYRQARGDFIALCEADDYWTRTDKLQQQVDFLKAHPGDVGVFHRGRAVNAEGHLLPFVWDGLPYKERYTQEDCIFELLSGYPTAALVFRRSALQFPFPKYFHDHPTDYMTDIMITENGSLGFLDFEGCAYRQHSGGTWSTLPVSEMKLHDAKRLVSLYGNSALRDRYPVLESRMFSRLDVAWWFKFHEKSETLGAWVAASFYLIRHLIMMDAKILRHWMARLECPLRHKLRDLLRAEPKNSSNGRR